MSWKWRMFCKQDVHQRSCTRHQVIQFGAPQESYLKRLKETLKPSALANFIPKDLPDVCGTITVIAHGLLWATHCRVGDKQHVRFCLFDWRLASCATQAIFASWSTDSTAISTKSRAPSMDPHGLLPRHLQARLLARARQPQVRRQALFFLRRIAPARCASFTSLL